MSDAPPIPVDADAMLSASLAQADEIEVRVGNRYPDGRRVVIVSAGDREVLRDALVLDSATEREAFAARLAEHAPALAARSTDLCARLATLAASAERPDARRWADPHRAAQPMLLVPVADLLDRPPVRWLAKGVLPRSGVVFLFGQPGSGKTFVALDIAQRVARGLPWCGRRTRQGPAVLLVGEGMAGLGQRAQAWLIGHRDEARSASHVDSVPLFVSELPHIGESEGQLRIRTTIDSMQPRPALVIVDTLAQALPGTDENSVQDVSAALRFLAALAADGDLCVVVVHHERKAADAEGLAAMRGSSALAGAADAALRVRRAKRDVVVEIAKQKDGRSDFSIPLRMEYAVIGTDEDGALIEVPYLRPASDEELTVSTASKVEAFLADFRRAFAEGSPSATDLDDAASGWGLTRAESRSLRLEAVRAASLLREEHGRSTRYRLAPPVSADPPAAAGALARSSGTTPPRQVLPAGAAARSLSVSADPPAHAGVMAHSRESHAATPPPTPRRGGEIAPTPAVTPACEEVFEW